MPEFSVEVEWKCRGYINVEAKDEKDAKRKARKRLDDGEFDYDGDIVDETEKLGEVSEG